MWLSALLLGNVCFRCRHDTATQNRSKNPFNWCAQGETESAPDGGNRVLKKSPKHHWRGFHCKVSENQHTETLLRSLETDTIHQNTGETSKSELRYHSAGGARTTNDPAGSLHNSADELIGHRCVATAGTCALYGENKGHATHTMKGRQARPLDLLLDPTLRCCFSSSEQDFAVWPSGPVGVKNIWSHERDDCLMDPGKGEFNCLVGKTETGLLSASTPCSNFTREFQN